MQLGIIPTIGVDRAQLVRWEVTHHMWVLVGARIAIQEKPQRTLHQQLALIVVTTSHPLFTSIAKLVFDIAIELELMSEVAFENNFFSKTNVFSDRNKKKSFNANLPAEPV